MNVTLLPELYIFTKQDIVALKAIGYSVSSKSNESLEMFINDVFPNFNLLKLLQAIESNLTNTTSKEIHRKIEFDYSGKWLKIEYRNNVTDMNDALIFVREFVKRNKSIEVNHEYCLIPASFRGKGRIKKVFQESLQQYLNINVNKIKVHAGLGGGGYVWAKHGFVGIYKDEIDVILTKARMNLSSNEFKIVEKIHTVYYSKKPSGKDFPMDLWAELDFMKPILMGSDWHGELNLKNKTQLNNFVDYVYR